MTFINNIVFDDGHLPSNDGRSSPNLRMLPRSLQPLNDVPMFRQAQWLCVATWDRGSTTNQHFCPSSPLQTFKRKIGIPPKLAVFFFCGPKAVNHGKPMPLNIPNRCLLLNIGYAPFAGDFKDPAKGLDSLDSLDSLLDGDHAGLGPILSPCHSQVAFFHFLGEVF